MPDWIAVDWGTTRVRAWAMSAHGTVLADDACDAGMGTLRPPDYEPALLTLIDAWLPDDGRTVPVIVCGMAGARQGWCEAPYLTTPCPPLDAARTVRPAVADGRVRVTVLHGVAQATPADVMRGEETQIAGWSSQHPDFDGTLCLPGTHTKWVRVAAGRIERFTTCLSGELFAAIGTGTVLRHSLDDGWDAHAFTEQVDRSLAHPQALCADLFSIRARSLLGAPTAGCARAALSGALIGTELAAVRHHWAGSDTVVIGSDRLSDLYVRALARAGIEARLDSGERCAIDGLAAAFTILAGAPS